MKTTEERECEKLQKEFWKKMRDPDRFCDEYIETHRAAVAEQDLKELSGLAYEFQHNLVVVPLIYALAAVGAERERCISFCRNYPEVEAKIRSEKGEVIRADVSPVAAQKPMTMAEIAQEIQRGNTYPGKVWLLQDAASPAPTSDGRIPMAEDHE